MSQPRRPKTKPRPTSKYQTGSIIPPKKSRPSPSPRSSPAPASPSSRKTCHRRWGWILLLLLLLIASYFLFFSPPPSTPVVEPDNSALIYIDNDDLWQPDAIVEGDDGQILEMKFGN